MTSREERRERHLFNTLATLYEEKNEQQIEKPVRVITVEQIVVPPVKEVSKRSRKVKISRELAWEVFERDDFRCKHCGTRKMLSADHIHPESLGGETTLENLQTLCSSCNSKKGARKTA